MIHYCRYKMLPALIGAIAACMDISFEMVNMLPNLLHFLCVLNWEGYLETIRDFLPYCFSLNWHDYARSLSYNYSHMSSLTEENIRSLSIFTWRRLHLFLSERSRSMISMYQIIEMTINRWCKKIGSLSGKIENVDASDRWGKINYHMATMREHLNQKVWQNTKHVNIELGALRVERHEKDKTNDPNKSRQLDTKYVTFRLTNQQYCNRKEIYRGDEKKYIKYHGKRIVINEWIYWEIYFTGRHNHRKFFLRSNKKAGCKSV